ncbi:MAG: phosphatidylglycerophosphatase A family protein [Planctomycetota bacterium]|jgi:phosphatidylglycerophosphatase A
MKTPELLTTCFGLGKMPFAPGTWGSLPPVVIYMTLAYLYPPANTVTMIALTLLFSWICVFYSPAVVKLVGRKDPGMIVADEVAGQAVTMLVIALLSPDNICNSAAAGFALFRLFDITKPWPCKKLEKLPDGLGILADDLAAGAYGAIVYVILFYTLPQFFG